MNRVDEEAEEFGSALHLPSLVKPQEDMTDRCKFDFFLNFKYFLHGCSS